MSAEEIVLDSHPQAVAIHVAPIYQHGQDTALCPEEWLILDQPGDRELGQGVTEHAAWEDAAKGIACPEQEAA